MITTRSSLIHLPALELLPLDCSRRSINRQGGATTMLATWIRLDLDYYELVRFILICVHNEITLTG